MMRKNFLATQNKGFTLMELMVVVLLFSVIASAGAILLIAGQSTWSVTDAHILMRDNLSRILQRISYELQESGRDNFGAMQVAIFDNTGINNSDILRFMVPICPCGARVGNDSGDIQYWGAPMVWGQAGCGDDYSVGINDEVEICHDDGAGNTQTINVNVNAVKSHLTHGDWIGDCNACTPANYANQFIEYRLAAGNNLVRRVLDVGLNVLNETVIAGSVTDIQATFNAGQTAVNVSIDLIRTATQGRQVTKTGDVDVVLRNQG